MLRRMARLLSGNAAPRLSAGQVEIVIVTKNSAAWIGLLLKAYRSLGIEPLVLLDGYSTDNTEREIKRRRIRYQKVYPEFPRVEAIIKEIPKHSQATWVLRLDDDEFPSQGLVQWLNRSLASASAPVLGVPRRWLRLEATGRCEYSNHQILRWLEQRMDTQWRLFRPDQVDYVTEIHSAGFLTPHSELLPDSAYLVHFDWILRSWEQRAAKLENYESQKPGAGSNFRDLYLWETSDIAAHAFMPMETDEFDRLARRLHRRAPLAPKNGD